MLKFDSSNAQDGSHTIKLLQEIEAPTRYFVEELDLVDAKIIVVIEPMLLFVAAGACTQLSDETILIGISPAADLQEDIVAVMAHELVHAQQIYRGDLRVMNTEQSIIWKDKKWTKEMFWGKIDTPWEAEAYGAMHAMAAQYRKQQEDHQPDLMSTLFRKIFG